MSDELISEITAFLIETNAPIPTIHYDKEGTIRAMMQCWGTKHSLKLLLLSHSMTFIETNLELAKRGARLSDKIEVS